MARRSISKLFEDLWYNKIPSGLNSAANYFRSGVQDLADRIPGELIERFKNGGSFIKPGFNNGDPLSANRKNASKSGVDFVGIEESIDNGIKDAASYIGDLAYKASGAEKQDAFTKMMSDTSIRRSVSDLEAAGINPLASVIGGGSLGASSNSSSSGVNSDRFIPSLMNGIAHIVSSSIHAASNDNRTLTMANSASAINTAKIASDAALKAAKAEYYQDKLNHDSKDYLDSEKGRYYHLKGDLMRDGLDYYDRVKLKRKLDSILAASDAAGHGYF